MKPSRGISGLLKECITWQGMLLALAGGAAGGLSPLVLDQVLVVAVPLGALRFVAVGLVGFLAVVALGSLVSAFAQARMGEVAADVTRGLLQGRFRAIFHRDLFQGDGQEAGDGVVAVLDAGRLSGSVPGIVAGMAALVFTMLFTLVSLLVLAGPGGGLAAVLVGAGGVATWVLLRRALLERRALVAEADDRRRTLLGLVSEVTANFLTIRSLPGRGGFKEELLNRDFHLRHAENEAFQAMRRTKAYQGAARSLLFGIGLLTLWWAGTGAKASLIPALAALTTLLGLAESLAAVVFSLPEVEASLGRLVGDEEAAPDLQGHVLAGPIESITFEDVWFRYSPDAPWVLKGISLRISSSEPVQISWPSGGGKTTLVRLLCGLIEPEVGRILVNGIPLATLDKSAYRARIGVLTQGAEFLSGSVWEMLAPALPMDAKPEDAWALLACVEADAFVRSLPLQLHTTLLQGGAAFSGGQTRRLALARALAPDRELVILDEPLAGLGESTDWLMMRVGSRPVLVCSHEQL